VVNDIRYGVRTDTDDDREHADQRTQERKRLCGKSGFTCSLRPNPDRYGCEEKNNRNDPFGDTGLVVFVSVNQHAGVNEGSKDES
jgi:hypothetical protein